MPNADVKENATRKPTDPTIYAAFADPRHAESAAGALIDHGVKAEDISLVVSDAYNERRGTPDDPELSYTQPTIVSGEAGATGRFDPMGNDSRVGLPPVQGANNFPVGEDAEATLNPAQDDYPRSGDLNAPQTELASSPVSAAGTQALQDEGDEGLDINRPNAADIRTPRDADRTIGGSAYDPEVAAKRGITTTTIGDAASAAKKGVIAGLGVGALAAVAALAIPGFGMIVGGGALATALAGVAASAGAGAMAGGVVGYLKDQGVPANDIPAYQQAYENGGAILAVHLTENANRGKIEEIVNKYGAEKVDRYGYVA